MAYTLTYDLINNETAYEVSGYTGEPVNVVIPSEYNSKPVTSIGGYAFFSCSSLTSIEIPDSVTSIGYGAFEECGSLTSVVIGNSVTSIGERAFIYCGSLTSIDIPDSVTSIGDSAFYFCGSLTSVEISDSVTSIGYYAFYGCDSLTSVVIPDSVTSIGSCAFENCSSLTNITLLAKTPATVSSEVFLNISTEAKFYCLSSAIDSYKTATNWNTYADKFVADDMRLYFTMNSRAQKNYFASKEWVNEQNFGTAIQIITWEEND